MKVLYLDTGFDSSSEYFRKQREKVEGCTNVCLYKKQNKGLIEKLIMAVGIYIFPPLLYLIYGDWKKKLNEYDWFIVASRAGAKYAIKYIRSKTQKRVVVWYWNLVTSKELPPDYCRKLGCETWSFDKGDCDKYGMQFGDTYYFPSQLATNDTKSVYSIFFVGINRPGRKEFLDKLRCYLEEHRLPYLFNLTAIPTEGAKTEQLLSKRMKYEEIIDVIKRSASILDLNREGQSGMTLRPLEALFFRRRLITNNENIVHFRIYDKANTYIVQGDLFENLATFLAEPYKECLDNAAKREVYTFEAWLKRIELEIEAEYRGGDSCR